MIKIVYCIYFFSLKAFASVVVHHGIEKHLLYQSPELFRKIDESKRQLLGPTSYIEDENGPNPLHSNPSLQPDDFVKHLKYLNETECPELTNIEVPKVRYSRAFMLKKIKFHVHYKALL